MGGRRREKNFLKNCFDAIMKPYPLYASKLTVVPGQEQWSPQPLAHCKLVSSEVSVKYDKQLARRREELGTRNILPNYSFISAFSFKGQRESNIR